MPRPPKQPGRSEFSGEELKAYDKVIGRVGRQVDGEKEPVASGHFGAMLNSPLFAEPLETLAERARLAGDANRKDAFSNKDREWVDLVLCAHLNTTCLLLVHIPDALAVGVRLDAIEALRQGSEDRLTEDEKFTADYIRQVANGTVKDEFYARLEQRIGIRGAVEYTIWIGFVLSAIRLRQAFIGREPAESEIDQMLSEFRNGIRALPDWRDRMPVPK